MNAAHAMICMQTHLCKSSDEVSRTYFMSIALCQFRGQYEQETTTMADDKLLFAGGRNIALKLPPHEFDDAARFYHEVLGLKQLNEHLPSIVFEFGPNQLWLDRVETMTQAELWLELRVPNTAAAARHFDQAGVTRCDAVEALPEGFDGFWISGPGNIIHLVHGKKEDV